MASPVVIRMIQHYQPIDLVNLNVACATHSDHYYAALTALAQARHELGMSQDSLKLRSAEISANTRRQHDLDKVKYTEGSIAAIVEAHEDVMGLRTYLREKELEVAYLAAQVSAIEARGVQLGNLVRLNGGGVPVEKACCAC